MPYLVAVSKGSGGTARGEGRKAAGRRAAPCKPIVGCPIIPGHHKHLHIPHLLRLRLNRHAPFVIKVPQHTPPGDEKGCKACVAWLRPLVLSDNTDGAFNRCRCLVNIINEVQRLGCAPALVYLGVNEVWELKCT